MSDALHGARLPEPVDFFTPIPMHPKRWLRRRFNQSEILATSLADLQTSATVTALKRVHDSRPQVETPISRRAENIRGAFGLTPKSREIAGATVCLVDDLTTTGSTLREAAKVLREAAPARIYAVVAAVAEGSDHQADEAVLDTI
jgi:predicted amidophosphoribosyltransferase